MSHGDEGGGGRQSDPTPRFCPRCRKGRPDGATLCPECGETLADRGYCAVCGRFWLLALGTSCPKHEIPLDAAPPSRAVTDETDFTDWISVETFAHPIAAEAPRIRLEAEGIPTFLDGERVGGHGLYGVAIGGVRLQVPRHLAQEARIVLSQTWATAAADDDLDDAWDDLAPEPGARRRAVMKAVIVLILLFPLLRALVALMTGG